MVVDHESNRQAQSRRYRLGEASRRFPPSRQERPVGPGALKRWIEVGVKARNGGRIRLGAERLPSGWVVTDEAIRKSVDAPDPGQPRRIRRGRSSLASDREGARALAPPLAVLIGKIALTAHPAVLDTAITCDRSWQASNRFPEGESSGQIFARLGSPEREPAI